MVENGTEVAGADMDIYFKKVFGYDNKIFASKSSLMRQEMGMN